MVRIELIRKEALITMATMRTNSSILLNQMNKTMAAIAFDAVATKIQSALESAEPSPVDADGGRG